MPTFAVFVSGLPSFIINCEVELFVFLKPASRTQKQKTTTKARDLTRSELVRGKATDAFLMDLLVIFCLIA